MCPAPRGAEADALAAVAGSLLGYPSPASFDSLAKRDAGAFIQLSLEQGLVPLLARNAAAPALAWLPAEARRTLRDLAAASGVRALAHLAQLQSVLRELESEGIQAMPLKGPALALIVHGDVAARAPGDLDILVPPDQFEAAAGALQESGYVRKWPPPGLSRAQSDWVRSHRHEFKFVHPALPAMVELHWALFDEPHLLPVPPRAIEAAEFLDAQGIRFRRFDDDFLYAYVLMHGAAGAWERLKWLVDALALYEPMSAERRARLNAYLAREGIGHVQGALLILAEQRLGRPIQPDELGVCNAAGRKVARQARPWFMKPNARPALPGRRLLYQGLMRNDWRYRWELLAGHSIQMADFGVIAFPQPFFALYFFLRPLLYLVRLIKRPS